MNNIIFGKYQNKNTIIHSLDVRVKLFTMFIIMFLIFLPFDVLGYSLVLLFLLLLVIISKISIISIYKVVKPLWLMFLMLLIINVLTIKQGRLLFEIINIQIFSEALIQTGFIVCRIIMVLIISTLLTSTSKPTELTYGIKFYLKPLKIFKVNIDEVAIMISIALRFIPTLIEETQKIIKSQTSRGIDFKHGKLKEKMLAITSLIVPLFVSSFEKADDLAIAMLTRGYDSSTPRSEYVRFKIRFKDMVAFLVLIILVVGYIILKGISL